MTQDQDAPSKSQRRAAHRKRIAERETAKLDKQAERSTCKTALRMATRLHNEGRTAE